MTDHVTFQFSTSADTLENWTSAVIRRMCHSPFSHVDFVLDDGNMLGASDQGEKSPVISGNPRGVAIRPPNYQRFGYRRHMVLRTDKADAIIAVAMGQLGKPFDNAALHDFLSDSFPGVREWRNTGQWFCSEMGIFSMEEGGFWENPPLAWPKSRVSPTDILMICLCDDRWINRDVFWEPVPGLQMDAHER